MGALRAPPIIEDGKTKTGYRYDGLHQVVAKQKQKQYTRFTLKPMYQGTYNPTTAWEEADKAEAIPTTSKAKPTRPSNRKLSI